MNHLHIILPCSWDHKRNDNKLPFGYYCAKSGGDLTPSDLKSFSDAVKKRQRVIFKKKYTERAIRTGLAVVLNDVDDVTEYEHLDNLASKYV